MDRYWTTFTTASCRWWRRGRSNCRRTGPRSVSATSISARFRQEESEMQLTRRDLGKTALGALAAAGVGRAAKINSVIQGVRFGAITYSFNSIANPDAEAIIKAYVEIGLGEAELMSNHCEALAGAPRAARGGGGRGAAPTPEQQAARAAQQEQI